MRKIREKVIVNSFVVLDRQKSAPSKLPKEPAIKVRIAEFFVHHASRDKKKKKCGGLTVLGITADVSWLGNGRLLLLRREEVRRRRKEVAEGVDLVLAGLRLHGPNIHPGPLESDRK